MHEKIRTDRQARSDKTQTRKKKKKKNEEKTGMGTQTTKVGDR